MPELRFEGTVFSGKGEGKKFLSLQWVTLQMQEKLGFAPFEGTLNLRLSPEEAKKRTQLDKVHHITIVPASGFCPGFLVQAEIGGLMVAIVTPQVPNYPANVLEIVAPLCLRKRWGLTDGSSVVVRVWV